MTRKEFFERVSGLDEVVDWMEYFGTRPPPEVLLAQLCELICRANQVKTVSAADFYPALRHLSMQSEESSIEAAKSWGEVITEHKKKAEDAAKQRGLLAAACRAAAEGKRPPEPKPPDPIPLRGPVFPRK